ncbi:MAG: lipopolysaccharide heptosyltransferase II, partial [Burkholderiales bacterium]|nr:lipopolysaccharide heptosyltransferase II [Burkholderiales bacterium]
YKVLIIAPSWVGDMVMAQTLFKVLKSKYGADLTLDVYANGWAGGLLSRMAQVNAVIDNPFSHGSFNLLKRIKEGFKLRSSGYNQVFVLPNSFKSAIVPFFAKISKRTGFIGESRYLMLNDIYKLDKQELPLMIDRFCALANNGRKLSHVSLPELAIDIANQKRLYAQFNLDFTKPVIAFCPAAEFGPAKRWPSDYFAQLADMVVAKGNQVIILGSAKDTEISQSIVKLAQHKVGLIDLCGKTNLTDVIDLLGGASKVVTNDSGLMHIACAVNVPVVALYGSSSPNFTPPLSSKAHILQIKLECSPCFQRTCRYGHYNCLKFITPEMVFAKL